MERGPGRRAMLAALLAMAATPASAQVRQAPAPTSTESRPMTFEVVEQRSVGKGLSASIYAAGDITEGTAIRFEEMVRRNNITDAVVSFDSGGGLVVESVRLGQAIRKLGFGTSVQRAVAVDGVTGKAYCASACVYAYAGGVARYLDDTAGRLGVHQYYGSGSRASKEAKDDLKIAQLMGSVIVAHLTQMGVSSALYVAAAMTDSATMLWMDSKQAEDFDLVNNGRMAPEADIRLTDDGHPYLLISQVADRGETRISISCTAGDITLTGGATGDRDALRRIRTQAVRTRFEIDGAALQPVVVQDPLGDLEGQGIETSSRIDATTLHRMDKAGRVGFSVEDISGRWRREIDVHSLRDKIAYYTRTCNRGG